MEFAEKFKKYRNRITKMKDLADMTEEATKTALIMPFFTVLGYDVFDPQEFVPELVCDVGTKKGEKIDYAVMDKGEPIILVEAKRAGMKLQKQQHGQLYRYFSVNRSRIAILTNGLQYNFYSDINTPNVMDDEPFLTFNVLTDDPTIYLASLEQFTKDKINIPDILSNAVYLKYSLVVEKTMLGDIQSPSDELIKYFLTRPEIDTGKRITAHTIAKYKEITADTLRKVMGVTINVSNEAPNAEEESQEISIEPEILPIADTVPVPVPAVAIVAPATSEAIIEDAEKIIREFNANLVCKFEDTQDYLKLHIYEDALHKLGIIKVSKSDLSVQFRKIFGGAPTTYELQSVSEITNYLAI